MTIIIIAWRCDCYKFCDLNYHELSFYHQITSCHAYSFLDQIIFCKEP